MPGQASESSIHNYSPSSASSKKRRRDLEANFSNRRSNEVLPASEPTLSRDIPHQAEQQSPTSKRSKVVSKTSISNMYSFPKSNRHSIDVASSPGTPPSPVIRKVAKVSIVGPQVGARRLEVRNARTKPKSTQDYYKTVQGSLETALNSILSEQQQIPLILAELYKGVKNVCNQGHANDLRALLSQKIQSHATNTVKPRLLGQISSASNSSEALKGIVGEWILWKTQWECIRTLFSFMDTSAVLKERSVELFLNCIMEDPQISAATMNGAVNIIMADRAGESADEALCRQVVDMCIELSLYTKSLEKVIFITSQEYFNTWALEKAASAQLQGYIHAVSELFASEGDRSERFKLSSSTRQELERLLEEASIKRYHHQQLLRAKEIHELMDVDNEADLKLLYQLLNRCKLASSLRQPFEAWIKKTGEGIIFDDKQEDNMVIRLITLRKQTDRIWINSFARDIDFTLGLRKAFENVMNKTKKTAATHNTDNTKQGEMIAKFVDFLLRGGSKEIPNALHEINLETRDEEEDNEVQDRQQVLNQHLDEVLDIFRFLHGKAVFEEFYKKDLAKRLLMKRSADADAELSMLQRLKTECGEGFTQNLETMFKDIELSREEMAQYKARELESGVSKSQVDLDVNILSASAWPSYPDIAVKLPPVISRSLNKFEISYIAQHNGRKLHWRHSLAHSQIKANFPSGMKELVVSGFQAIVLLLFNDIGLDEHLTYQQISEATSLPDVDLHRTLQSLACAKLRPIRKNPQGRDINPTDTFSINKTFTHKKYRIKINQVQLKETKEENKETHERVMADREFETQAAIVRIMKSKKTISHTLLVTEVIDATKKRGVLSGPEIKKQIERLIEKDYMERVEGSTNMYSYVA